MEIVVGCEGVLLFFKKHIHSLREPPLRMVPLRRCQNALMGPSPTAPPPMPTVIIVRRRCEHSPYCNKTFDGNNGRTENIMSGWKTRHGTSSAALCNGAATIPNVIFASSILADLPCCVLLPSLLSACLTACGCCFRWRARPPLLVCAEPLV